jgi:hypothetical protein
MEPKVIDYRKGARLVVLILFLLLRGEGVWLDLIFLNYFLMLKG